MHDGAAPCHQVGTRERTITTWGYDYAADQVIRHGHLVDEPVYELLNADGWAKRCLAITLAKHPEWQGLPAVDVQSDALPDEKTPRHQWRLVAGQVVVDPAVPDPPHPKQALLDAIDAASSLAEMKAILKRVVQRGG